MIQGYSDTLNAPSEQTLDQWCLENVRSSKVNSFHRKIPHSDLTVFLNILPNLNCWKQPGFLGSYQTDTSFVKHQNQRQIRSAQSVQTFSPPVKSRFCSVLARTLSCLCSHKCTATKQRGTGQQPLQPPNELLPGDSCRNKPNRAASNH